MLHVEFNHRVPLINVIHGFGDMLLWQPLHICWCIITFLLVLALTRIDKYHGGRLELLTSIYIIYMCMIRSEVNLFFFFKQEHGTGFRPLTVGNLFYRGSKRSRKTPPTVYKTLYNYIAFYRLFSLVSIFVDKMQAPRYMREKSSRELYDTCGLWDFEDSARFSRDFYMNFNNFSAVPRDTRGRNFSNHCGIHTTAAIMI